MKSKIININDISESREVLEKKPPKYIYIFIYIFISIMVGSITWASLSEKEIVVKCQGVVESIDSNIIKAHTNGQIFNIKVKEGDYVKKGDLLIALDSKSLDREIDYIKNIILKTEKNIKFLKMYEQSILSNKNLFSKSSTSEKEFYYKYLNYQNKLSQNSNTSDQEGIRKKNLKDKISSYNESRLSNENEIAKLRDENKLLEDDIKKLEPNDESMELGIENTNKVEENNSKILEKKAKISENNNRIDILSSEIKNLDESVKSENNEIEISDKTIQNYLYEESSIKNTELVQNQEELDRKNNELDEYKTKLKENELNLKDYDIRATRNGAVHFVNEINKYDTISEGTELVKINTSDEKNLLVELYIQSKDIANIQKGQDLKLHSYALPYQEFGFINSKIDELDIDSSISQKNGESYYKAKTSIKNKPLKGNEGKEVYLKMGMPIEGQIIVAKKSYLQLSLEKLDLWINGNNQTK
jgi:membrane fusion protein, peptide pheromone/bacteriocin exporter